MKAFILGKVKVDIDDYNNEIKGFILT